MNRREIVHASTPSDCFYEMLKRIVGEKNYAGPFDPRVPEGHAEREQDNAVIKVVQLADTM